MEDLIMHAIWLICATYRPQRLPQLGLRLLQPPLADGKAPAIVRKQWVAVELDDSRHERSALPSAVCTSGWAQLLQPPLADVKAPAIFR